MKTLILCVLFFFQSAHAAQVGQVIVDDASVYEYPQFASKTISKLQKGQGVQVSNLPTEGFYKVRLKNGDLGWISGNDVLVGGGGDSSSASAPAPRSPQKAKDYPTSSYPKDETADSEDENNEEEDRPQNWRIILGGGLQNSSYKGLSDNFENVGDLNYGMNVGLEIQWRATGALFWAIRTEALFSSAPTATISTGYTQSITELHVPIQVGLVFSPFDNGSSRLSVGLYAGISPVSSITVTQNPPSGSGVDGASKTYSAIDPVATGAIQGVIGLGRVFGLFGEIAYRYEKTSAFDAGPVAGTTVIPSFTTDFSGVMGRLGLELRF